MAHTNCTHIYPHRGPAVRQFTPPFAGTAAEILYAQTPPPQGGGASGNYYDMETGDEYWVSGPKSNGRDRHWAGSGPVEIDVDARQEYWTEIRKEPERVNEKFA